MAIMQRTGLGGITNTIRALMPQNELFKKTNLFPDRDKMRVKLRSESEQIGRVISGIVESDFGSPTRGNEN